MAQGTRTAPQVAPPTSDNLVLWRSYVEIEKGLLPNTIRLYQRTLERIQDQLGPLDHLQEETIRVWLHAQGGSAGTYSNRISAMRSYFKYLVRTKVRPDDPTTNIDTPKQHKGLPKPVKNLAQVLEALDAQDAKVAKSQPPATRRRIGESRDMAVFLAETGLRIHEAVVLNEPTPCGDALELIGKGHKEARIPLTTAAREALDRLGGRWPIGARATQRRFEKVGIYPHQLRHTLGCTLAAAGCDLGEIQDLLRHSSPATTRTYAAYSMDRLRGAQARREGVNL